MIGAEVLGSFGSSINKGSCSKIGIELSTIRIIDKCAIVTLEIEIFL